MTVVSAHGLVKTFGRGRAARRVLDGADLDVAAGEVVAVIGRSGSGKSTLLHCAAGLDSLTSGEARIGDVCLGSLDDRRLTRLRRDRLGFIFQAFNLMPTLTAAENITLPLALEGKRPDPAWFERVVDVVGLRERLGHRPGQLSGGQQQRVAAARALVSRPEVIFADEPTGNLDSRAGTELLAFMREAVDGFGQTIVMVTHDPKAAAWADRVVFLADGEVVDEVVAPTADAVIAHILHLGD